MTSQDANQIRVLTVVGARPQFVKVAPVSRAIAAHNAQSSLKIVDILVHTGQHYDHNMSQVFFDELQIAAPAHFLAIGSGPQGAQTGEMLARCEEVIVSEKPHLVLVYGDTNSTLAGALAAAKLHIPVAHVEAGLRSFNRRMPEEINRVLTDHVSDLLFIPTETARKNLNAEGIVKGVHLVGDVMYDAAVQHREIAKQHSHVLHDVGVASKQFFLATVHRAENTDAPDRLAGIVSAFEELAQIKPVVWPLHPRTRKRMSELGIALKQENLKIIEPASFLDMMLLESNASLILTDSGGVQKEAQWFAVPCVTLRDETEWVETVESGWNRLAGADRAAILDAAKESLENPLPATVGMEHASASDRIVALIAETYGRH